MEFWMETQPAGSLETELHWGQYVPLAFPSVHLSAPVQSGVTRRPLRASSKLKLHSEINMSVGGGAGPNCPPARATGGGGESMARVQPQPRDASSDPVDGKCLISCLDGEPNCARQSSRAVATDVRAKAVGSSIQTNEFGVRAIDPVVIVIRAGREIKGTSFQGHRR
ncbi:unnamed protein product [Phytophthora fragariaefolia]|uniref:Unnamed protein product n=1 Tax=Phytophthora fragariaefolia TaxID=1490495 RepID=A0A9W6XME6_9STRA|nr:unnamed protein product [Phytophthora fragariaefolia]